jgi:protein-L-isoaspartate(D-aspartate) O-methyltransferase
MRRDLLAIGVGDPGVLRAMAAVPRRLFVPEEEREGAAENAPLPIGHGQTISAPDVVGYMTQALGVGPGSKVLDVGTGSGYQAAVLAELGCRVFSVEIVEELARSAAERLRDLGYHRVVVRAGDGYLGWPEEAPFDGIVVAAAPDHVPEPLVAQLRPGARLVLPVGPAGRVQRLLVLRKREDGTVSCDDTLAVRFVPMTRA